MSGQLVVTLTRPELLAMLGGAGTDGVHFDGDPKILPPSPGSPTNPTPFSGLSPPDPHDLKACDQAPDHCRTAHTRTAAFPSLTEAWPARS